MHEDQVDQQHRRDAGPGADGQLGRRCATAAIAARSQRCESGGWCAVVHHAGHLDRDGAASTAGATCSRAAVTRPGSHSAGTNTMKITRTSHTRRRSRMG